MTGLWKIQVCTSVAIQSADGITQVMLPRSPLPTPHMLGAITHVKTSWAHREDLVSCQPSGWGESANQSAYIQSVAAMGGWAKLVPALVSNALKCFLQINR